LGSGCGGVRTGIGEGGAARAWGSSRTGVRTAGAASWGGGGRGRSGVEGGGVAGATMHAGENTRSGVDVVASRKAAARSGNGDAVRGGVRGTARARWAIEAAC
jgi:hypothetical protein